MPNRSVDIIEFRWWVSAARVDAREAARAWLRLAREHLPQALPRRYDVVEPPQHKLDTEGDDAFVEFVARTDMFVHFNTTVPFAGGAMAGPCSRLRRFDSHNLAVLSTAVDDEGLRTATRTFFICFAAEVGAIVATAHLLRDWEWTGRSLRYVVRVSEASVDLGREEWVGLPADPPWWMWFGPDYAPLVQDHLSSGQTEEHNSGLFHQRSVRAEDATRRDAPWLPSELLLTDHHTPLFTANSREPDQAEVRPLPLT